MTQRQSTKQRILAVALDLFNGRGERKVTTNHIAEAAGISPGNLYYHYKNKAEIIYALFDAYRAEVVRFMAVPEGRALTWVDKVGYFEAIFGAMLQFRFFHRDLPHLLQQDEKLRDEYHRFVRESLLQTRRIYEGLAEAGLIEADADTLESLIINTWVIATSWASFLDTAIFDALDAQSEKALIARGIYQIIALEAPYLRGTALARLPEIRAQYGELGSLLDRL